MTANQERRLLLAALDYAEADRLCRTSQRDVTVSRAAALKARRKAKRRLLSAAGENRQQIEIDLREALTRYRPTKVLPDPVQQVGYLLGERRTRGGTHEV